MPKVVDAGNESVGIGEFCLNRDSILLVIFEQIVLIPVPNAERGQSRNYPHKRSAIQYCKMVSNLLHSIWSLFLTNYRDRHNERKQ
jgi:hypothetical protein